MEFKKNDQAIYIEDLLFAVLKQWRKILVVALALAVVLGAYKGYNQYNEQKAQISAVEEVDETENEEKISKLEEDIAQLEQNILAQETHIETAAFMQFDAYEIYSAYTVLYVKTPYQIMPGMTYQNPDDVPYVISAIRNILINDDTTQKIAQEVGYGEFSELVNIYPDGNLMVIMTHHADAAAANALLDAYMDQLVYASASVKNSVGEHSYTEVSRTCEKRSGAELVTKQNEERQRLSMLEAELSALEDELKALSTVNNPVVIISNVNIVKSALIFAVVGAVGGFFLVALFVCLQHITGSKVYSARMLEQMTGIGVLGAFPTLKKPCKGFDRLLKKLEHRQLEASAAVSATIMANLRNYCPAGSKLLIAGACDRTDMEFISKLATENGYVVLAAGNLRKDADVVSALSQCDGLVLAEACGVSLYPEVERSAVLARDLDKPVVGCILIDG